jgi:hypothetical protein
MKGNFHVRFLEGKSGVTRSTYSTKKGFSGMRSLSPASISLYLESDVLRIPFLPILRSLAVIVKKDSVIVNWIDLIY